MGVSGCGIRKGLKDGKGRRRKASAEPGPRSRLLVDPGVDVPKERLYLVSVLWLGFKVNVISLLSRRIFHAVHHKAWMLWIVLHTAVSQG